MRIRILIALLLFPVVLFGQIPEDEDDQQPDQNDSGRALRLTFKNSPSLRAGDVFRMDLKSKWHLDFRHFYPAIASPPQTDDTFVLTRARFGLKGNVTKYFEYEVERELRATFGDQHERHPWRDVYVDFGPYRLIQVKVGKFKLPFGLEELTSEDKLDFAYRSRVTEFLAPARDKGVMLHGKVLKGDRLNYQAGVFRNDGENSDIQGVPTAARTYAARVTGQPLRFIPQLPGTLHRVQMGLAVTTGQMFEGLQGLHGQTASNFTYFPHMFVKGRRQRFETELLWREGPFSIKGEFMHVSQERKQQSIRVQDLPDLISNGWYVTAGWVALGKMKAQGGAPKNPFLTGHGFGAVELAARFDVLGYTSATHVGTASRSPRAPNVLANSDRTWTFGATWYVNHFVKIQANGEREWIEDIERGPVAGRNLFWTSVFRLQFAM